MPVRPIPRKRRREKEIRQAKAIAFLAGAFLLLARIALVLPVVIVPAVIAFCIDGDPGRLGRTVGGAVMFLVCLWAIFCVMWLVRTLAEERRSRKTRKKATRTILRNEQTRPTAIPPESASPSRKHWQKDHHISRRKSKSPHGGKTVRT